MRILVITIGTRGDVQPYLALAKGLQSAGHELWLATDATFESFVTQNGVGFRPLKADPRQAMQEDVRQVGANPVKFVRWLNRQFRPLAHDFFRDVKAAAQGMDAMLFATLAFPAYHVAEGLGIPALATYLQPATPTRYFAGPAGQPPSWMPFKKLANRWVTELSILSVFSMTKGVIDECRQEMLGLSKLPWGYYLRLNSAAVPIVYGYSQHVVPKPPDWGDWLHVVGYWFLDGDEDWQPPGDLDAFLQAGLPPVYIGFGSMIDKEAQAVTEVVLDALVQTGQRAILYGGWGELGGGQLPENVLRIDRAPHSWLFPRMAAVVHHGGAGTTAAALRAGVPSVIVPFFADQPFWAGRVESLGVGPRPISRQQLNARRLAEAINVALRDDEMRRKAAELGRKISAEDGVGAAVPLIERLLGEQRAV